MQNVVLLKMAVGCSPAESGDGSGSSKFRQCQRCQVLSIKINILEAKLEVTQSPEKHANTSSAILYEALEEVSDAVAGLSLDHQPKYFLILYHVNGCGGRDENESLTEDVGESEKNESLTKDVVDETEKNESLTSLVDGVVSLYMNDASTHPSSPVNAAQSSSASPPQSPPPPPEIGIRRSSRTRKEPVKYSPSFSKNKKK
ncbi:unnamed protein product [Vicia faba]|uniref:Uncharacterized protein n=1 Tax=Vicia faba TaxID=3906 RepID=A0AAV0ZRJ0_VICFA|nr:unnamed protein product [Vicia faba]